MIDQTYRHRRIVGKFIRQRKRKSEHPVFVRTTPHEEHSEPNWNEIQKIVGNQKLKFPGKEYPLLPKLFSCDGIT